MLPQDRLVWQLITTVAAVLVGLAFFAAAFAVVVKGMKVPLRKEIEEDQNTALAVLIGAVILGIAIIIAAAVHGG